MESAVQTTPPMRSVCSMPLCPLSPMAESSTAVTISVVSVMPEMGVMEIMAMAQAETAANRKEMPSVSSAERSARRVAPGSSASTAKRK
ncbi:MAG: hypothetical protein QM767_23150 [Anaeromyxobacter sp.]